MKVQLWNRELRISDEQRDLLVSYILEHLAKTRDGRESITYMVDCIRSDTRLQFPTRHVDAESMFEALGFIITRSENGRTSFVTV